MEVLIVLLLAVIAYLLYRGNKLKQTELARSDHTNQLTAIYEDHDHFCVHFPSMTFVSNAFVPTILYWGPLERTRDGEAWRWQPMDDEQPREWRELEKNQAARVEAAYQRFCRAAIEPAPGQDRLWFVAQVALKVERTEGECSIYGGGALQEALDRYESGQTG